MSLFIQYARGNKDYAHELIFLRPKDAGTFDKSNIVRIFGKLCKFEHDKPADEWLYNLFQEKGKTRVITHLDDVKNILSAAKCERISISLDNGDGIIREYKLKDIDLSKGSVSPEPKREIKKKKDEEYDEFNV